MTATDTSSQLMRAVLENPFDDGVRLVFADEIEPYEPELAELIRLQCQMSADRSVDCSRRICQLIEMEIVPIKVIGYYGKDWSWSGDTESAIISPNDGSGIAYTFRRGFVDSVSLTLAQLLGGPCERCNGTGSDRDAECDVCGNKADEDGLIEHGRGCYVVNDDGGGMSSEDCRHCNCGRIPSLAPALAAWPITQVTITDAVVHPSGGNDSYYLGNLGAFPQKYWRRLDTLWSRRDVLTALSRASVDLIRERAVPPLKPIRWN